MPDLDLKPPVFAGGFFVEPIMTKDGFGGFSKALPAFLHDLSANNDKVWFGANRERFDKHCVMPCLDFIHAVADAVGNFDPPHKAIAKTNGSLRPIHRDSRFSTDKTPYHAFLHLIFWTGDHPVRSPGINLVFSTGGFGIGAGQWALAPQELARYRAAVQDGQAVSRLLAALDLARKSECHLEAPALKRAPKGFVTSGENHMLLRQKGIVVRNRSEAYPEGFFGDDCVPVLLNRMRALLPLQKWMSEYVSNPN